MVLPLYQKVKEKFSDQLHFECYDYVDLAWRHSYCGLFSMERDGVTWYFLDNEQYFRRPELYGYMDDGERFGFFSRAVVRMLPHMKFWPEVIHCNDWQTALVPIYLKDDSVREERFRSIRTVLSIHNIEYQGRYGRQTLGDLFGLDHGWADDGTILMDGDVNLLKGAILCADAINAVSPTYANELKMPYFAHRLDGIMRRCGYKLSGVLNGIDVKRYDPAADPHIAVNYSAADMAGKQTDKAELQKLMGLRQEPYVPIVGIVSRLVSHKGLDLVCEVLHDMMELPLQMVILGKGDRKYEEFFQWAAQQYSGRMAVRLDYNEALSMAIDYAEKTGARLVAGTDPDCDRVGVAVRDKNGDYVPLTGNQLGCVLLDGLLKAKKEAGTLPKNGVFIKTIVTSELARAVAQSYGVETVEVLTGFKFIGEKIKEYEQTGEHTYLFGFEESYGYLVGTHARDKDGVVTCMLLAQTACGLAAQGKTLLDGLEDIYARLGYWKEKTISFTLSGMEGIARIKDTMARLCSERIESFGSRRVKAVRNYNTGVRTDLCNNSESLLDLPKSNVLYYELEGGWACVRPSGTEPKLKVYLAVKGQNAAEAQRALEELEKSVRAVVGL